VLRTEILYNVIALIRKQDIEINSLCSQLDDITKQIPVAWQCKDYADGWITFPAKEQKNIIMILDV